MYVGVIMRNLIFKLKINVLLLQDEYYHIASQTQSKKKRIMELYICREHSLNTLKNRNSLSNLHVNSSEYVLSHQYIHKYIIFLVFVFFKLMMINQIFKTNQCCTI